MEISKQINNNECGVCVLHSLIQYHHNKNIPMHQLITESNLSDSGLSIYDLEIMALNYGITLDSYNASIEELQNLGSKNYYIIILNDNDRLHYVIARNNKKNISIYCSNRGEYELTWEELKLKWTGIYISCEKSLFKTINKIENKEFIKLNWKYLIMMNSFGLLGILINIFCGTFIQKITTLVIDDKYLSISIALIFTYLSAYLLQYLISWFTDQIYKKTIFENYQKLSHEMVNQMKFKYKSFYKKINYKYLIDMDEYNWILIDFYYGKLNQYIANTVLLIVITFMLASIDLLILVFTLGAILISVIIDYIMYKFQHNNWIPAQNETNDYKNALINLVDFNKTCNDYEHEEKLLLNIKETQYKLKRHFFKTGNFNQSNNFIDSILQIFLFTMIAFFGIQLVMEEKINIGKFLFCISLTQMMSSSVKILCLLPNNYVQFKHARSVISNILEVDNIKIGNNLKTLNKIEQITYKNLSFLNDSLLVGRSGVGKSYCLMQIANLITNDDNQIKFNNIISSEMDALWLKKNCIYLNNAPYLSNNIISELFQNKHDLDTIIKCLEYANIKANIIDFLSMGQKQILSILNLLAIKNKIILLDESLSNVDSELKLIILKIIKPLLLERNFLIYVDHNSSCHHLFSQKVIYE